MLHFPAPLGQSHQLSPAIGRIGNERNISVISEIANQLGHALLGHSRPLREHGDARAVSGHVPENCAVSQAYLWESGFFKLREYLVVQDIERRAQQGAKCA